MPQPLVISPHRKYFRLMSCIFSQCAASPSDALSRRDVQATEHRADRPVWRGLVRGMAALKPVRKHSASVFAQVERFGNLFRQHAGLDPDHAALLDTASLAPVAYP